VSPVQGFRRVGTILALLGVAFRFRTLAGQADAQTLGGIYEVPPIFLFALLAKGGPDGASLAAVTHRTLKAVYSLTCRSEQVAHYRYGAFQCVI
jgi:hypothetical protein